MSQQNNSLDPESPEILLMGGSGFVGSAVAESFVASGWRVRLLTRTIRPFQMAFPSDQYTWDGASIPHEAIAGVGAVINLAGQPIFDHAWTPAYRRVILDSRTRAGEALTEAIDSLSVKPEVVIQISGTDYYGMDPRDEICDESAEIGGDFMADVGRAGEDPVLQLNTKTRLCIARMGLVLGWEGGGLPQLWDVYASACGGVLGKGQQWMNWVHIADVARFCLEAVSNPDYAGVYNLVAPANSTNREFHHHLCEHTPSLKFLAAPGLYLKAMMGKRANFLLQAPRVTPKRTTAQGFTFHYPDLDRALHHLTGERTHPSAHCIKVKQWLPLPASPWPPEPVFSTVAPQRLCRLWHHHHQVHPLAGGALLVDRIEYQLPLFPLGELALRLVRERIKSTLQKRRETLATLAAQAARSEKTNAKHLK